MEFIDQLGWIARWLFDPETNVPAFRIVQTIAAVITAAISAVGFYKAWLYAERRLGRRLDEFLEHEEERLAQAREAMRALRTERSVAGLDRPKLFSNGELELALKHLSKKRTIAAKHALGDALTRTQEREDFARRKGALHQKQRAMAHLLLGRSQTRRAITNPRSSIFNPHLRSTSTTRRRWSTSGCSISSSETQIRHLKSLRNSKLSRGRGATGCC